MHGRCGHCLVQCGAIRALPAFNLRELGNDAPIAAVQVGRDSLALRFDANPALALLAGGNPMARREWRDCPKN